MSTKLCLYVYIRVYVLIYTFEQVYVLEKFFRKFSLLMRDMSIDIRV